MTKLEICGFEHLHLHSHFSLLDGLGTCEEYASRAKQINQQFLCVTDHGMMGAIPSQIRACEENGITSLYGCELYCNDEQPTTKSADEYAKHVKQLDEHQRTRLRKSYHLLAIAYSDIGYKNLVQLSSWAYHSGYGGNPRRPRVTHEQLMKHKEGIVFSSCCYLGEVGQAFERGGKDLAYEKLEKYMAMFGENFRLEIMLLDFKKQKPYNAFIIEAHDKYHVPLWVTCDTHYCQKEDSKYQRYMLMTRTKRTIKDVEAAIAADQTDSFFELQDQNLWMKSEEELNEKWFTDYMDVVPYELFCQAKRNTVVMCQKAKGVQIDRSVKLPHLQDANLKLKEAMLQGFKKCGLPVTKRYTQQMGQEYDLIVQKDFASYFLITKMFVDEARRVCPKILGWGTGEEAVGPGRGSAVSFLTCYLLGITDVDPIQHDLIPERFLSEARGGKQMKLRFNSLPLPEELAHGQ